MESKEFKRTFAEVSKNYGFEYGFGAWFKESEDCIVLLDLQRSRFGAHYQLIIKVYVHWLYGEKFVRSKELARGMGNMFRGIPPEYNQTFDLDNVIDHVELINGLNNVFLKFIVPFADRALLVTQLIELGNQGLVVLQPAVKAGIQRLLESNNRK